MLVCQSPSIMKSFILIIVLSNIFIFGNSEELSCTEVQEAICKSGTQYKKESFQKCLVNNTYWKNYFKNKLDFIANPFSEFLLRIVPLGDYQNGSTTVGLTINQFQLNEALTCRLNFDLTVTHIFESGKNFLNSISFIILISTFWFFVNSKHISCSTTHY
jgi:hypothetical protein